jgi:hypothetical protein
LTIKRTPHSQNFHHQMTAADLPDNTQSNFVIILNIQYVKYHILILFYSIFYKELPRIFYPVFVIRDLLTFQAPTIVHTKHSED